MGLIDTHCHLNDESYNEELETVLEECKKANVTTQFVIGTNLKDSKRAVELANKYDSIYAIIGFHPDSAKDVDDNSLKEIEMLAINNSKVIGIGEIGLDYYWDENPSPVIQKEAFIKQIELAKKLNLPIIIHSREATLDTYEILKKYKPLKGIMHCFSGSYEMAMNYIDLGLYISFAGPLTFKNAINVKECAAKLPLESLLIETDSPYLTPHPYRGKRNYPYMVRYIGEELCRLKEINMQKLEEIENNNIEKLFQLTLK